MNEAKSRRNNRVQAFDRGHKIDLIYLVKKHKILWDITHPKHFDSRLSANAWESIGIELDKDPKECRNAWQSLRDSLRYHMKTAAKRKLDRSDGADENGEASIDWEYAEYMHFVIDRRRAHSPLPSMEPSISHSSSVDLEESAGSYHEYSEYIKEECDSIASCSYNYEEIEPTPKKKKTMPKKSIDDIKDRLAEALEKMAKEDSLKSEYVSLFGYWESLFRSLPPEKAQEAKFAMTELLQNKCRSTAEN